MKLFAFRALTFNERHEYVRDRQVKIDLERVLGFAVIDEGEQLTRPFRFLTQVFLGETNIILEIHPDEFERLCKEQRQ
jgi:hypothetical protein